MTGRYQIVRAERETEREAAPELILKPLWYPDHGIRAGGRICHDGRNLYVSLWAKEKPIRAEYTLPASPVHEDSCLEFFLMPAEENRYLNFEINPNGCLHLGFGRDRQSRKDLLLPDEEEMFRIRAVRTEDGWGTAYRIPVSFLREFYPAFECRGILRANVYKCGDKTPHPHYLAWNPVNTPAPDFHRPECFGEMKFE